MVGEKREHINYRTSVLFIEVFAWPKNSQRGSSSPPPRIMLFVPRKHVMKRGELMLHRSAAIIISTLCYLVIGVALKDPTIDIEPPRITQPPDLLERRVVLQDGYNKDLAGWYWKDGCQ
jgi:hypothetical protein